MNYSSIPTILERLEIEGYQVVALIDIHGIEVTAVSKTGEIYRVKARPGQRYEACCELAKQLNIDCIGEFNRNCD